jgi:hypothetical protein
MAEEKRVQSDQDLKRGALTELGAGFLGGVGAGVGTGLVAKGSQVLGKLGGGKSSKDAPPKT